MWPILFLLSSALLFAQAPDALIDNDSVRVHLSTDQPVPQPGAPHEHKLNRVMVYLDTGDMQIKWADGKVENQHWKPGDVAFSKAGGIHTSQNVSSRPIRIIEIELKKPGNESTSAPDRTRAIIDNAQVRVYQARKTPPKSGDYVAVNIGSGAVLWDGTPKGPGPFVFVEIK